MDQEIVASIQNKKKVKTNVHALSKANAYLF